MAPTAKPPAKPAKKHAEPKPKPTATPAPRILSYSLSETNFHPGDLVHGSANATLNVASIEVRIDGYSISMDKVAPGRFTLSYTVPNYPFFVRGPISILVIARNTQGAATTETLSGALE